MNIKADEELKQLPFEFSIINHMGRDDFMVSECNRRAFTAIENYQRWVSPGLFLYGPQGCGKSHLAHLFVERIRENETNHKITVVAAQSITMKNVRKITAENDSIVIENLSTKCNEEALFHLFNFYNQEGHYMLWTGRQAPHQMHFKLADLGSRLNMLPCVEIREPDDIMLQALVVKLFNDRQLLISPEILNYIINNAERSFSYIQQLVKELDELSMARQSAVNYVLVKEAMEKIALQNHTEPDLFSEW